MALRAALLARCGDDSPAGAWRAAAAAAGVAGADAHLCHLSRSIAAALEALYASAEAARSSLQSAREAARAEDEPHCDELEASIASTESSKRAALERELCAVDAVLERIRDARDAATAAAASLGDAELSVKYAELTARLDAAEAQLLALPTAVVEPAYVGLVVDEAAMLVGNVFGRVVAPLAIAASDLVVDSMSGTPRYAHSGCTLLVRLELQSALHASQSAEELGKSLAAAAAATDLGAMLEAAGAAPLLLPVSACADIPGRCVTISIFVPLTAPIGASVCFGPLTLAGQRVASLLSTLSVEPPGPVDLSHEQASQLQDWIPHGGSTSPDAWEEVYRGTRNGFGGAAFHTRCDGHARLLVLVRAREGGWLFGGFTAVGFSPHTAFYADPSAFLFSLTNSLGRPEKLESKQHTGMHLYYDADDSASFGNGVGLHICANADTAVGSYTNTGHSYMESSSTGAHPMAQGYQEGWFVAEVVAWVV